ncbi:LytR/AlgR family response regulator transcription factor [Aureivirga sp. CE67]|uniref:LytR/AlgR family response regulator transcription factor n=1 Tax=Aureivirga sp. CE67 TaxID=1788983 RepID=UPI0018CBB33B|nr:LytTR family DNA-binding domain-containing protein [Aureivirga sp. CE67]
MTLKSTYNCIIIDDERFARELIEDYLKSYPEFVVIGKYKNTSLAKEILESDENIDLIFLDIQMPNETGIEFLKNNTIQPKVIFTTAYSEYALESYELNVVDYLLKPITEDRFDKAIQKLKVQLNTEEKAKAFELMEIEPNNFIKIKTGAEIHKIYFNELIRLQADGEYIKYFTKEKTYLILGSLKKLSAQLPPLFIQIHRSHVIALSEIKGRENYTIILNDFTEIPIGKTYRTKVLQQLKSMGF